MAFLHEWMQETGIAVTIELGLQTVNYHSLAKVRRGHGLAEYIDAVQRIRQYPFDICTHVILNLPVGYRGRCGGNSENSVGAW